MNEQHPHRQFTTLNQLLRVAGSGWVGWGVLLGTLILIGSDRRGVESGAVYELTGSIAPSDQRIADALNEPVELQLASHESASAPAHLRVGTFNIHSGKGRDEIHHLERTLKSIPPDLDLLFLQEVRGSFWPVRSSQAETLGTQLAMRYVFLPVEEQWFQPHFGNALLSRKSHPLIAPLGLPCTQGKKYRGAVLTRCAVGDTKINLLGAHLDLRVDHDRQLDMLLDLFESLAAPKLLLGDLNTLADDEAMVSFLARTGARNVFAGQGHARDWMIVDGLIAVETGIIDQGASDHGLLWAELTFDATGEPFASR